MKKAGFIILLTFFVLLASGAFSKGYWYAYCALVTTCIALIVKKDRYLAVTHRPNAKALIVASVAFVAIFVLYGQYTGSIP